MPESPQLTYGLFIYLPETVDAKLEAWTTETPGASWPPWRGHITLINGFRLRPEVSEMQLVDALKPLLATLEPFEVTLAKVIARPHLLEPELQIVMLVEQERPVKETRLFKLRQSLYERIAPLIEETEPLRIIRRMPFHPHITLTLGLAPTAARALLEHAKSAPIDATFAVTQVTLVGFNANEEIVQRIGLPFNVNQADGRV
jgi:2'-5' RNA ligase